MNGYLRGLALGGLQGLVLGVALGLLLYAPAQWLIGQGVPAWVVGAGVLAGFVGMQAWRDRRRRSAQR